MTALLAALLRVIAVATVLSGAVQMLAPAFVLRLVGGEGSASALHFFAIVGMFMVLFGVLMILSLGVDRPAYPLAIAGLQKFGASGAVVLGIVKGLFGPLAWLVSGFDFVSGVVVVIYLMRLRSDP